MRPVITPKWNMKSPIYFKIVETMWLGNLAGKLEYWPWFFPLLSVSLKYLPPGSWGLWWGFLCVLNPYLWSWLTGLLSNLILWLQLYVSDWYTQHSFLFESLERYFPLLDSQSFTTFSRSFEGEEFFPDSLNKALVLSSFSVFKHIEVQSTSEVQRLGNQNICDRYHAHI